MKRYLSKAALDNRSNQLNPNNRLYQGKREKKFRYKVIYGYPKPDNSLYVLCDLNGNYLTEYYGWSMNRALARKFSKGAVIACMRELKKINYRCYYDIA